jgi:hypothetical protein
LAGAKTFTAGLNARVSTHDQQTLPMQLRTMRAYAKQRGWSIGMEVRDVGSGANVRPEREAMLKAARRCKLDVIMVWVAGGSIAGVDRCSTSSAPCKNSMNSGSASCRSPRPWS